MTLKDKCMIDWRQDYEKEIPIPWRCKKIYTMNSDPRSKRCLSFTSIGSEYNVLGNGATLYFDYNTVYPISDSSRKSLPMRLRAYETQLRTRNLTIKRRALDRR